MVTLYLYSLLVELALVFPHADLTVLLFLTDHVVYLGFCLLELLDRGVVLLQLRLFALEGFEKLLGLSFKVFVLVLTAR
jgi:hypothetical protein